MGLKRALAGAAARAPAPVFPLVGSGARDAVRELRLRPELDFVSTPRAAGILLVAGQISEPMVSAAAAAHDSLGHPRATLVWPAGAGGAPEAFPEAVVVDGDPVDAILRLYNELVTGRRPSEGPILPDIDPAPWRGIGPYGQGGTGMTGGVPFGRPLAGRGEDRDGLSLDEFAVRLGPFLPPLPSGLMLDLKLSGDVLRTVQVVFLPMPSAPDDPFYRALTGPVPIAELEMARARSHLCWLSDALSALGMQAIAERALRLSANLGPGDAKALRRLCQAVRRTGATSWATAGTGVLDRIGLSGAGAGPVARAAGLAEDARMEDQAYVALGFEPVVGEGGDIAARWRQRLSEAVQSLELALAAGDLTCSQTGRVESPRGELSAGSHPSARLLEQLPAILEGREWGDAVATIVSLDLDMDGAGGLGELALKRTVA